MVDPISIPLVLSILPIIILAVLLSVVYNHGKRVGRLEARASSTRETKENIELESK